LASTLITPRAAAVAGLPTALVRTLWQQRHVIAQLGRRQVQSRHRGSLLGWAWVVLNPLLQLAVYTLAFTVLFPVAGDLGSRIDFSLRLFCGLVLWWVFADTVSRAPTAIVSNPNFVKKVVFPLEALPAADLYESLCLAAVNLAVLGVAALIHGSLSWTALLFPLAFPPLVLLSLGTAWFFAALGVYMRDLRASIGVLITALMFLTPIFYRLDDVPARLRGLLQANPLAVVIETGRRTLLWAEQPDWVALSVAYAVGAAAAVLGFAWFRATKRGFADVL
jgi:lipopolysaccharide transport system permease protein